MAISKRLRYEILQRDNRTCRYCHATDTPLTIDHVTPVALGGTDDPSNLVAACKDCNAGKSSSNPEAATVAQVSDDAVRWAAAMQAAADRYRLSRKQADALHSHVYDEWESCSAAYRFGRAKLPDDADISVDNWVRAGAPVDLIDEAIGVAMRNKLVENWNVWRYACGVVWTRLAQMQEEAREGVSPKAASADAEAKQAEFNEGWDACWTTPEVAIGTLQYLALSRVTDGLHYALNGVEL